MVENSKDARKGATETLNEAVHSAAEASRRTIDGTRAAVQVTRDYLDQSAEIGRKLFDTWASGTETSLQAAFELQNTALAAGLSLLEANNSGSRAMAQQWSDAAHQAQQAALAAWQANINAARKLSTSTAQSKRE